MIIDLAILRTHVDVSLDFQWKRLSMFAAQAQEEYLRPVLGDEFLQELQDHMDSSDSGPAEALDAVLAQAQCTLSIFTMYLATPNLQLRQSDSGLHVMVNEAYRSPYQWQVGDYREAYLLAGYGAMEKLYRLLMKYAGQLPTWRASDSYAGYNDSIIRNAKEFNRHYRIGSSVITFADLKPAIDRAQDLILRKVLGATFYNSLITWVAAEGSDSESDSSVEADLMDEAVSRVRKALTHLAIGEANEVNFRLVNGGLLSTRYEQNSSNDVKVIDERLNMGFSADNRKLATKKGYELLAVAQGWLDEHADDFPLYRDGPGYRAAGKEERPVSDRMHDAGSFFMV